MVDRNENKIEEILKKDNIGEKLLENLKNYIDQTNFKDELDQFVRNTLVNKDLEQITANDIFDLIHNFTVENLPSEIQEKLFYDVRQCVDENIDEFKN